MIELIAALVVDLSDQKLTVYDRHDQVVRVIPVSTGKASTHRHRREWDPYGRNTAP